MRKNGGHEEGGGGSVFGRVHGEVLSVISISCGRTSF